MLNRRSAAVVSLLLVLPLVAGACLVRTPDGRTVDCRQVVQRYKHKGHIGRLHRHERRTWSCVPVTTTTPTTTSAPQAPVVTVTGVAVGGTGIDISVSVADGDSNYEQWVMYWKLDGDAGWTSAETEWLSDTTFRLHTRLPAGFSQGSVKVVDNTSLESTATWSYDPCAAPGDTTAAPAC